MAVSTGLSALVDGTEDDPNVVEQADKQMESNNTAAVSHFRAMIAHVTGTMAPSERTNWHGLRQVKWRLNSFAYWLPRSSLHSDIHADRCVDPVDGPSVSASPVAIA
jgi:hypothetical protein